MSEEIVRPAVGDTIALPPRTHPALAAIADARDQRPVILFFLRAFS